MGSFVRLWNEFERVITGTVAAIALLISCYEMFTRYFFPRMSPDWGTEVVIYLIVWAVFISGSALVRDNRHVRADLIIRRFPPQWQRGFEVFNCLIGLTFCAVVTKYGIDVVEFAYDVGERSESSLLFPIFLYYLCLPVGMALMTIRYAVRLWQFLFAFDPASMAIVEDEPGQH
jgi:TRAP-type C4-dicarboxylate transport system permease small subunit